jgi:glycosyltransferase involved in cell wall biosynthesis
MSRILILAGDDMSFYKFRKELIIALLEKKHEIYFASLFEEYKTEFERLGCKLINVKTLERRGTSIASDLRLFFTYKSLINKIKPDLILTYTLKPRIYGNLAAGRTPIINTVTGMGPFFLNSPILVRIATFLDRWGMKYANHVFFQNEEARQMYIDFCMLRDIPNTVVPASGVNLRDFSYQPYPEHDVVNITFVGRIMKDKGVEEFLEAATRIHKDPKYANVHFKLFGFFEEDYKERIDALCKTGVIEYGGFVKDIRPYLADSDCVVLPSYHEGVGNAIQEAAASGRPVITTDIPGCRGVVEHGITGYLCQARSTDSLYEQIVLFLALSREERLEMGVRGRRKMEHEHDRDMVIKKYIEVIEELITRYR